MFRPVTKDKYLGLAHIQSGDHAAAIAALNRALAKAPKDDFANLALVAALALDDRVPEARKTYARFLADRSGAPPTIGALRASIGWMGPKTERMMEGLREVGVSDG